VSAAHRFDLFLGAEPPECRKRWHELDRIATRCGVGLDELVRRVKGGEGLYGHAKVLVDELVRQGSMERLYALTEDRRYN
jgi:hypothetical protein